MIHTLDIYLIRHSKPSIESGVCYGHLDCPVSDDYQQQLQKISAYFSNKSIDAIYSSPLLRCSKLAEDLASQRVDAAVIYNESLKEINFGDWEGVKWHDIPRGKIDEWNENRLRFQFPNGETPEQFHSRVYQAWCEIIASARASGAKKLLLVAHSGVICSLLCRHRAIPLENVTELKVDYASISKISVSD